MESEFIPYQNEEVAKAMKTDYWMVHKRKDECRFCKVVSVVDIEAQICKDCERIILSNI